MTAELPQTAWARTARQQRIANAAGEWMHGMLHVLMEDPTHATECLLAVFMRGIRLGELHPDVARMLQEPFPHLPLEDEELEDMVKEIRAVAGSDA